jgi:hypothetical protein
MAFSPGNFLKELQELRRLAEILDIDKCPLALSTDTVATETRTVYRDMEKFEDFGGWDGVFDNQFINLCVEKNSSAINTAVIFRRGPHGLHSVCNWLEKWFAEGVSELNAWIRCVRLIKAVKPYVYAVHPPQQIIQFLIHLIARRNVLPNARPTGLLLPVQLKWPVSIAQ